MASVFGKTRTCGDASILDRAECNIVVLGMLGSGKSALTVKFLTRRFISEYDPNLEDIYSSEEVVDQHPVLIRVMDTADQDGPVNCERYLNWASAFLVVYSIDDQRSFEGCQQYLDVVTAHAKLAPMEMPVILLGNKLDMERYRKVSECEGSALASHYDCLFFEVSACQDFVSVRHVFHEAVREVRREVRTEVRQEPDRAAPTLPFCTTEDRTQGSSATSPPLSPSLRDVSMPAGARLVSVKGSRAQGKRRAPSLTLLKGFRIF